MKYIFVEESWEDYLYLNNLIFFTSKLQPDDLKMTFPLRLIQYLFLR